MFCTLLLTIVFGCRRSDDLHAPNKSSTQSSEESTASSLTANNPPLPSWSSWWKPQFAAAALCLDTENSWIALNEDQHMQVQQIVRQIKRQLEERYGTPLPADKEDECARETAEQVVAILTPEQITQGEARWPEYLRDAQERSRRVVCQSHLRVLWLSAKLYAANNHGTYPPDLAAIVRGRFILPQDLGKVICPATNKTMPNDITHDSLKEQANWVQANSDYVYLAAGKQSDSVTAETPIFMDKPENHYATSEGGANVIFGNAHIEFVNKDRAKELLQQASR